MRRKKMLVGGFILSLVFSVVPAWPQAGSAALRQEPALPQQMPQEDKPLTERQKMEMRGDLHMARKQYPEAIGVYQTLLQEEPKNAVLLNKIGIAYHQLQKLDVAKKFYERSVKADKKYANAHNNIGMVEYDRRKYRSAIKHYRRALDLAPDLAATHSNLGFAYFGQKKFEEAQACFQTALNLDPELFERRSMFGSVIQGGSVTDRPLFYFFLAKSFALQGNAERAAHYLRKARDEGYKNIAAIAKDESFAQVINDPLVQEVLSSVTSVATTPAPKPEPQP